MKEAKAMAYVNMYGVLACLENLCEIDDEAKAIIKSIKKPVSLCFRKTVAQSVRETMAVPAK